MPTMVTLTGIDAMKNATNRSLAKVILLGAALLSLQACSSGAPRSYDQVAQAFDTPGITAMKPYTRTIFSSNDF